MRSAFQRSAFQRSARAVAQAEIPAHYYLDPDRFAQLFRSKRPGQNRRKIAAGLYLIATQIVRGFSGPHDVLEDAAANALLRCLLKLGEKQIASNCRRDPFSYFSSLIWNSILNDLRKDRRRRGLMQTVEILHGLRLRGRVNASEARAFREELRHRRRRGVAELARS